jgi:hypothetical protein
MHTTNFKLKLSNEIFVLSKSMKSIPGLIGSDGKVIITRHLITIDLTSIVGYNFTELSDPIGSDCRIRSDSNTMDRLLIPQPGAYEFHRIPTELPSVSYRIR